MLLSAYLVYVVISQIIYIGALPVRMGDGVRRSRRSSSARVAVPR